MTTPAELQKMHRRAQKAEGELARLRNAILNAGRQGRRSDNGQHYYYLVGWMVAHTSPASGLIRAALDSIKEGR